MGSTEAHAFTILPVESALDLADAKHLITVYTDSLGLDLTFQNLVQELAEMPGQYDPGRGGALLLARDDLTKEALGVVCLRRLLVNDHSAVDGRSVDEIIPESAADGVKVCEIKRLYVTVNGRGRGVGRSLAESIVNRARDLGYSEMKLDTLLRMTAARHLWAHLGFEECEKYYENPVSEAIFLRKLL